MVSHDLILVARIECQNSTGARRGFHKGFPFMVSENSGEKIVANGKISQSIRLLNRQQRHKLNKSSGKSSPPLFIQKIAIHIVALDPKDSTTGRSLCKE